MNSLVRSVCTSVYSLNTFSGSVMILLFMVKILEDHKSSIKAR